MPRSINNYLFGIFVFVIAAILIVHMSVLSWFDILANWYYPAIVISAITVFGVTIITGQRFNWNIKILLFLFVSVMSIFLNNIDPFFQSGPKLVGFTLAMAAFGPLLNSRFAVRFKESCFTFANYIIIGLVIISAGAYLLGFSIATSIAGVNGVFNQSMVYGPMAGLASLFCLNKMFDNQKTKKKSRRIFKLTLLFFIFTIAIFGVFIAASRGALGATAVAILYYIIVKNKAKKFKLFGYLVALVVLASVTVVANPFNLMDSLNAKMDKVESTNNFYSNRDMMWKDRIDDFKSSPIIGVGFESMKNTQNSVINEFEGSSEPGSGWLSILGSLGLSGFILYSLLLIIPIFTIAFRKPELALFGAFLLFFAVHTTIEGYSLAVGNALCIVLWMTISIANFHTSKKQLSNQIKNSI